MTLTVIRIGGRWRYESDPPHGTPAPITHEIHVPDRMIPIQIKGEQRYQLQPHEMNLLDAPLSAERLLDLARLKLSSQIYIVTTVI